MLDEHPLLNLYYRISITEDRYIPCSVHIDDRDASRGDVYGDHLDNNDFHERRYLYNIISRGSMCDHGGSGDEHHYEREFEPFDVLAVCDEHVCD